MFPNAFRAILIAFIASAVTVSALPSISVKVSAPLLEPAANMRPVGESAVTGIDKLVVKTTVTNTGDEIITLLNHPESPLNKLPTNKFTITDATGSFPAFTGIKVKYVPATAIAVGKDAVTVLAPGQSVEVEHNLSEAYAFDKEGEYKIVSNNQFYLVNVKKEAAPIYATVNAYTTTLTGKLSIDRFSQVKRATFIGCSSSQQSSLISAASGAQSYAANAYS
ncbi:hypothetical protein C0992_004260 [Termitomyces sp. T32_za158]|nr:hypothetical protein C0992_004260 [Termitomyces sp. T32_za158]